MTKTSRVKNREIIQKLKESTPCTDCKNYFPHYIMEYDHKEGFEKLASVSYLMANRGLKIIMAEIEKCDLVCANCHRERTNGDGRYKNQFS